jgi:hypothetical protein
MLMAMTVPEAFEKATETFNAHDNGWDAEVLAVDVVFQAPGGTSGQRTAACLGSYGNWCVALFDALRSTAFTSSTTSLSSRARSPELTTASCHSPLRDIPPTGRSVERERGDDLSAG